MHKNIKWALTASLAGLTLAGTGMVHLQAADVSPVELSVPTAEVQIQQWADDLLAQMTLIEKIGQLTQIGAAPIALDRQPEDLIRKGMAGSVLWTIDTAQIDRLQKIAVEESRLGIPLLFGFDVVHGFKNVFPMPIGMAASWDPELVERACSIAAEEAYASGINWTFAPMVDIARDARWGRMVEGAGEDPFLGEVMARAQVHGYQGPVLGTPGRILSSTKHFAAYGAAEGGRDYDSCYVPDVLLYNVYLRPFQACIDAGVGNVMTAYMSLNDIPATGNPWLVKDLLRDQMGFQGFVISDSYSVLSMTNHGYSADEKDAARRGIESGVNMDMGSQDYLRNLEALVAEGKVSMGSIDELVREVLIVKLRMGLFEHPYGNTDMKDEVLGKPAHRSATLLAAQKSMVLLRNEGGVLPLSPNVSSIALIGPLADSAEDIKGPWTCEWDQAVSVREGLAKALPNTTIHYVQGGDMQRAYPMPWEAREGKPAPALMDAAQMEVELAKAVEAANASELVVMVLGERKDMCGEAASSSTIALGGNQQALLEAVVATGKPVVLVLLNGRPLDITWASENVPAILEAWFPGSEGGNAIADVLTGAVNPGGKLPVSWPRSVGQCPIYYNHNATQSPQTDQYFTSLYANDTTAPLYPFGHGLSYTSFSYSNLKLDRDVIGVDGTLNVSFDVRNSGQRVGDEVVQLYIHQRYGSQIRPVRELKGFERVTLRPGETRTVSFIIGPEELRYWNVQTRSWLVESSTFDVWVGGDSTATTHSLFRVE
jgi:beta-glucosidase